MAVLGGELVGFGLAVAFSPVHIALLLLLLLGEQPLRRGGWFVATWLTVSILMLVTLLALGHGLLLTMDKGTSHRTGLDLLAAGALLALGLRELLEKRAEGAEPPRSLNRTRGQIGTQRVRTRGLEVYTFNRCYDTITINNVSRSNSFK